MYLARRFPCIYKGLGFQSLLLVFTHALTAAPINPISTLSLGSNAVVDFESSTFGSALNLLSAGAVTFGERFAGQALTTVGDFDRLSGLPAMGFTIVGGLPNQSLYINAFGLLGRDLNGVGPGGASAANGRGEGSMAALFDTDQSEVGMTFVGTNGGTATISFFARDSILIDRIIVSLADAGISGAIDTYTFHRDGAVRDIAGFTVENDDPGGIGLDDVRYTSAVPEPVSVSYGAVGIIFGLIFRFVSRRRKS